MDYLHGCITEALLRLQDPVVAELDDSSTILKELNRLVVKMLENSDRTLSFVVLLQLLREAVAASPPRHKFTDFVMKCLLKLTKVRCVSVPFYSVSIGNLLVNTTDTQDGPPQHGSTQCRARAAQLPRGQLAR